ncbi:MAG: secretin and TonB N-terminal domain-containing protein, partial [Chroococcidiopsis sp.]
GRIAQAKPAPTTGTTLKPGQSVTVQKPLFPNPEITVDGKPVPPSAMRGNQAQPPFLPRAVAPPVGDMAISNTDASPALIDLGSQERVPRLVLRDAPVREVLSLLARAAGLNLAYTTATPQGQQGQPAPTAPGAGGAEGPKVTLDIQDESVQDVFNHVLRITGLQANREGRTIFVGPRLPNDARNLVTRSYRLNQVTVGVALNFLVAMGAESAVSRERTITSVQAVPVGGGQAPATQTQTSTETRIETQRIDFQDSTPLLRGLEVVGDERTNSVTLIGSPKQVQVASAQLIQLDSRRRQVAINVKIADINLLATEDINTSFSFGLGDTFLQNDRGSGIINFGTRNPQSERDSVLQPGFARQFLSRLQAQIVSGNAKVLTDPTLIVQEGQQATVNLTQEVVGNITRTITGGTTTIPQDTTTIQKERVGLTVGIKIERVDDNGFVALSVAPTVKAVQGTARTPQGDEIALINDRSLTSGLIRLRDNQTLILSGIIQESDRTNVSKVPILGDIPIIGALFRSTNKQNQRQEVIVLLTPQIIDDSERSSSMGYNYNPSPDARQMLERSQNRKVQTPNSSR